MSLAQGNNTPTWPRIEPGSPDPESDALTTRPVAPNYNIEKVLHLLNDFLTIDRPISMPERTMAILTMVFKKLGLPSSTKKTVGPAHVLEYLGVILGGSGVVSVSCFGVRVSVMFHFMFVHYTFSSVWVAEWPPFGK